MSIVSKPASQRQDLSAVASALLARPIAQLVIDARIGSAEKVRRTAGRYALVADELDRDHPEIATILRTYAALGRRHALEIEQRRRRPEAAPYLRLIEAGK